MKGFNLGIAETSFGMGDRTYLTNVDPRASLLV